MAVSAQLLNDISVKLNHLQLPDIETSSKFATKYDNKVPASMQRANLP